MTTTMPPAHRHGARRPQPPSAMPPAITPYLAPNRRRRSSTEAESRATALRRRTRGSTLSGGRTQPAALLRQQSTNPRSNPSLRNRLALAPNQKHNRVRSSSSRSPRRANPRTTDHPVSQGHSKANIHSRRVDRPGLNTNCRPRSRGWKEPARRILF